MTDSTTRAAHPTSSVELGWDDMDAKTTFAEVREQLADPAAILANALLRVHQADEAQAQVEALMREAEATGGIGHPSAARLMERREYLVDVAHALGRIAGTAVVLNDRAEVAETMRAIDDGLDELDRQGVAVDEPQEVRGVRFAATLTGHYLGVVGGGREWLYVEGAGYVDISDAEERGARPALYCLTGRVVSATATHALLITDGGMSMTLPRHLIHESPDE